MRWGRLGFRVVLCTAALVAMASAAGATQTTAPAWIDVDRVVLVTTEAGDLLIAHQASWDDEGAQHRFTISNLSFDPDGSGLQSFTLPLPRAIGSLEDLMLPDGWTLSCRSADPGAAAPETWASFSVPSSEAFRTPGRGLAVGQSASFTFRMPAETTDGLPYAEEMARYGVIRAVEPSTVDLDPSGIVEVRELIALPAMAIEDRSPTHTAGASSTYPLGTPHGGAAPVFPGTPTTARRLPDLALAIETQRSACGTLETGEAWLHVPLTVQNLGGAATWASTTLRIETPLGVEIRRIGPIDAGSATEIILVLHGPATLLQTPRIAAIIDPSNAVPEADETNNAVFAAVDCAQSMAVEPVLCEVPTIVGCPDLAVTVDSGDTACREDPENGTSSVELMVEVRNTGTASTPVETVLLIAGGFGAIEAPLSPILPQASHALLVIATFDRMLDALIESTGTLGFGVTADPGHRLEECSEDNNQAVGAVLCTD
jgi:hypothetical protein